MMSAGASAAVVAARSKWRNISASCTPGLAITSSLTVLPLSLRKPCSSPGTKVRQVPGPSTRLDLLGVQFSAPAPTPFPLQWAPHLCVIVHCPAGESPNGALEVRFLRGGEQVARSVQPLQVEQGKFNYQLVRAEIDVDEAGTVEAHCRIDLGPVTVVPYTLLAPVDPS